VHCTHCGLELDSNARFCSSCGSAIGDALPATAPVKVRDWDFHVNVLAWIMVAHAAITALIGLIVMFAGQVAAKFILDNPRILDNADPDIPPEAFTLIGPIAFLVGVLLLIVSMPSVAAGVGLLRYRNWGRVLTLLLSVLGILQVPLGTATAIYSFWVLLSEGGKSFFKERAARAEV
jgi:zinc-ribbon domain